MFVIFVLLIKYNFNLYDKTTLYYRNFLDFIMNKKSVTAYQNFFDRNTPLDYATAQFLKSHTHEYETIFLWGDSAQIYKLSGTLPPNRYTVAYHIIGAKDGIRETAKSLLQKPPRFIVLMSKQNFPFDLSKYRYAFSTQNRSFYEYNF